MNKQFHCFKNKNKLKVYSQDVKEESGLNKIKSIHCGKTQTSIHKGEEENSFELTVKTTVTMTEVDIQGEETEFKKLETLKNTTEKEETKNMNTQQLNNTEERYTEYVEKRLAEINEEISNINKEMPLRSFDLSDVQKEEIERTDRIKDALNKEKTALLKMAEEVIVGGDIGNGNVKWAFVNEKAMLKLEYMESNVSVGSDTQVGETLTINGVKINYNTTESVLSQKSRLKDTDGHRALLHNALYKIHKQYGTKKFKVCMGTSLDSWNKDKGESVKNKMEEAKEVNIKDNGREFKFTIDEVRVQPECVVAPFGMTEDAISEIQEKDFILVDIGNLNISWSVYKKGLKRVDFKSNTGGMDKLLPLIAQHVSFVDISDDGVDEAWIKRFLLDKELQQKKIYKTKKKAIQQHVDVFVGDLIQMFVKLYKIDSNYELAFIGGGSEALREYLKVAVNSIKDNYDEPYKYIDKVEGQTLYSNVRGLLARALKLFATK